MAAGLGSAVVLCFVLDRGVPGLWWGLAFGVMVSSTLLLARFMHRTAIELPLAMPEGILASDSQYEMADEKLDKIIGAVESQPSSKLVRKS